MNGPLSASRRDQQCNNSANEQDWQKKLAETQNQLARNSMKEKLTKIAELFEMDVLSEEDALKACKTVISQHAKVNANAMTTENDTK